MTVGSKLHQALNSLRSAKTDLEAFSLETQDQNAKQLYADSANQLNQVIQSVAGRVNYTEQQEPQYKANPNKKPQNNR